MRRNLLHPGHKELKYEIREIVEVAKKIASFGVPIIWENIGDPVEKGEMIPRWLKDIVIRACEQDSTYAYSHSKGMETTREYLASKNEKISKDDIIFFNGLGEAINKTYGYLAYHARIIGPNPAYSAHASAEGTNSGSEHITYSLDPKNDWNPDLEEIENKVKYNPNVVGILVVNPDNPTGKVFKKEVLEGIISIAKKYDLFVIFDEIYEKLTYEEDEKILLEDIIGEIPGIAMKGLSKELPWPGGRCGWIEIYNQDKDENFKKYISSIVCSKMLELCSTTLPQKILPEIYEHPEFHNHLEQRIQKYKKRANVAEEIFGDLDEVSLIKPKGAFYLTITFQEKYINKNATLSIENTDIKKYIESLPGQERFDKKFCYYLLATTGICVVPLSGFNSHFDGIRITLLEEDEHKYIQLLKNIKKTIINFKEKKGNE